MLVKIFGGAVYGINALTITIEVNILWGAKSVSYTHLTLPTT